MALFLYHAVFGVRYLGILNGVAAFVIIGIGEFFCNLMHRTTFCEHLLNFHSRDLIQRVDITVMFACQM